MLEPWLSLYDRSDSRFAVRTLLLRLHRCWVCGRRIHGPGEEGEQPVHPECRPLPAVLSSKQRSAIRAQARRRAQRRGGR